MIALVLCVLTKIFAIAKSTYWPDEPEKNEAKISKRRRKKKPRKRGKRRGKENSIHISNSDYKLIVSAIT